MTNPASNMLTVVDDEWMAHAECRPRDYDSHRTTQARNALFFPEGNSGRVLQDPYQPAREYCADCPNAGPDGPCVAYALANHIDWGMWGGYTPRQRRELRRRKRLGSLPARFPAVCKICGTDFLAVTGNGSYCSEDCRQIGQRTAVSAYQARQSATLRASETRTCKMCGEPFVAPINRRQTMCSRECRTAAKRGTKRDSSKQLDCARCGLPVAYGRQRYCSDRCARDAHNEQCKLREKTNPPAKRDRRNPKNPIGATVKCVHCGITFIRPVANQMVCSDTCRRGRATALKAVRKAAETPAEA